jgi:hypothetical protein
MNIDAPNSSEPGDLAGAPMMVDVRALSQEQFAQLGMARLAYVKPVIVNGSQGFAIHAADGTPMAVTADRDVAIAAIVQHEMLPAMVH